MTKAERVKGLLERRDFGTDVVVQGWVRSRRDSKGGFSFLDVNDGSSLSGIQVVAEAGLANYESEVMKLVTGGAVRVAGTLAASEGKGQSVEVMAMTVEVVGWGVEPET